MQQQEEGALDRAVVQEIILQREEEVESFVEAETAKTVANRRMLLSPEIRYDRDADILLRTQHALLAH